MLKTELNGLPRKRHDVLSPIIVEKNLESSCSHSVNSKVCSHCENAVLNQNNNNNNDLKGKVPRRSMKEIISNLFYEYCEASSIHGFRYIGDRHRPYWDRGVWLILTLISFYGSYNLVFNAWMKWQLSPVIVSFDEKSTPIWHIPFPAVTICPETKARTNILNFTHSYSNLCRTVKETGHFNRSEDMSLEEFHYLRAVLQVCESYLMDEFNFSKSYDADIPVLDLLQELSPSFNESYPFCKWRNVVTTCERYFTRSITEDGVCYTFNGLDPTELYRNTTVQYNTTIEPRERKYSKWTLENGFQKNERYPKRVLAAGTRGGFFMAVQGFDYNLDYFCRGPIQGFKVLLHSPDEVPQVSKQYLRVPFDQEVIVSVKPNMITTSKELSNYEPHKRQCFFNHERKLRFFKIYTQNNCNSECLANYTLNKCGCVKFSMPRTPNTPICDISNITCYDDAEDDLLRAEFEQALNLRNNQNNNNNNGICDCLPACTSLSYNTEISQASFDLLNLIKAYNSTYIEDNPGVKMSRLSIFFKEHQFITSKRSELYGLTDFAANCGGLFGLFMGVSVLSVFELFYFIFIRLIALIRN